VVHGSKLAGQVGVAAEETVCRMMVWSRISYEWMGRCYNNCSLVYESGKEKEAGKRERERGKIRVNRKVG
jgi:hypothetical protein